MFCYYPNTPFYKVDYGKNVGLSTIAPYLYQLNAGINAYKNLPDKHGVKWCAIIGVSRLDDGDYEKLADDFGSDDYEKIDGRPLVYVFTRDEEDYAAKIRQAAKKRGFAPFVIPAIAMGWDPRPRIDAPVVWYGYPDGEYEELGEKEILDQAEAARKLPGDSAASVGHATFFAWDEFEEGGWICPTVTVDENGEPVRDNFGKIVINDDKLRVFSAAVKVLKSE